MSATFPLSWRLYLIEILHQTTTVKIILIPTRRCILSKFYIKPQPERAAMIDETSCILSKFYIKPQLAANASMYTYCCILSKFYIKPQHLNWNSVVDVVVSYRNSTSNHNSPANGLWFLALYLIEILHQTTTERADGPCPCGLYLIEILHQTTTVTAGVGVGCSCILSKFYIKPQRSAKIGGIILVVSYRNSTSNHNPSFERHPVEMLYLIEILHQTTTRSGIPLLIRRCILSKFYIKPQRPARGGSTGTWLYLIEILHQTTTFVFDCPNVFELYLIEILHQTTTPDIVALTPTPLYLIEILHQTTTASVLITSS